MANSSNFAVLGIIDVGLSFTLGLARNQESLLICYVKLIAQVLS